MGKARQFLAARVHQAAEQHIRASRDAARVNAAVPAPWVEAVRLIPPAEVLTRTYPVQHGRPGGARIRARGGRPAPNLYRPTKISFPEDRLRRDFYRDHPWELARPKLVLELDGLDARARDWSRGLRQPGMALSGESVVQRQLWLMENEGLSKAAAYDAARREFYALRQQEEIERRVAVEEARMYGGYFGQTDLQVGMAMEDAAYEAWKKWATDNIARLEADKEAATANVVDSAIDRTGAGVEEEALV